jgi:hypothetical protein
LQTIISVTYFNTFSTHLIKSSIKWSGKTQFSKFLFKNLNLNRGDNANWR